jgi:hypothetical protein
MENEHPPFCTCVDCVNRRLAITKKKNKQHQKYKKTVKERSHHHINFSKILKTIWFGIIRLLAIISLLLVVTIITVIVSKFITNDLTLNTFIVYIVISLVVLIWCITTVTKHKLSFSRVFLLAVIVGIISFISSIYLDVRSFKDIVTSVEKAGSTNTAEFRNTVDLAIKRTELKVIESSSTVIEKVKETTNDLLGTNRVFVHGAYLIGADGHAITLKNNPNAKNPTWEELKNFLLKDKTDLIEYDYDKFVCADFAEMVHNNAEQAGIKAAYVSIKLGPCAYYPISGGHALNAFETTDKGLVYIDCTGYMTSMNADKIIDLQLGKEYVPKSIFPEPGWSEYWDSMSKVEEIETVQW